MADTIQVRAALLKTDLYRQLFEKYPDSRVRRFIPSQRAARLARSASRSCVEGPALYGASQCHIARVRACAVGDVGDVAPNGVAVVKPTALSPCI